MGLKSITHEVIQACIIRSSYPISYFIEAYAESSTKEMDLYLKFLHNPYKGYWAQYIEQSIKTGEIYTQLKKSFQTFGGSQASFDYMLEPINEIIETKYYFLAQDYERLLNKTHNDDEIKELEDKIASSRFNHSAA